MPWAGVELGSSSRRWEDGYVVDAPYFEPIAADLSPAAISLACVLHGQPPLDLTEPMTWVDLGCGSGLPACMVAAGNPNVTVYGYDFNPAHIERARRFAAVARVPNCTFEEATFGALAHDDRIGPPEADVIVVHGVYSWIAEEHQRHIVEFIRRRLRPGGVAYVMYEVAAGWASMVPIAEAMRLAVAADGRRSDVAFADAATMMTQLAERGADYFPLGPREADQFGQFGTVDALYAAHEYLGEHFRPLMFDDVVGAMAGARCTYVGSLDATDYLTMYWATPALSSHVGSIGNDFVRNQLVRDLVAQRALRRDLFRRGLAMQNPMEQRRWVEHLSIVGLGKEFEDKPVDVPLGGISLDPALYVPLVQALADGPLDVARVRAVHPAWTPGDALSAMSLLVGGGYAAPALPDWAESGARDVARRVNVALIAENRAGADHRWLLAPATGAAVAAEHVEMLVTGALWDGAAAEPEALTDYVLTELANQDRAIRDGDVVVDDPAEVRAIVARRVGGALDRIGGTFAALGIS